MPTSIASEQERLAALQKLGLLDLHTEERFDRITRMCAQLFGVRMAAVNLISRDRQHTLSCSGIDLDDIDRTDSFCTVAIEQPRTLVIPDAREDARFADNPFVVDDPHLRFYAGQPLVAPDGHVVGTLCLFDSEPRQLDEDERDLLIDMAGWVEEEMAVTEELERAGAVQRGLLPQRPPEEGPWELAGACTPARGVGGDLFDWYVVVGGRVVTLADVMGKGMSAAIMMATLRAVLRSGSRRGDIEGAVEAAAHAMDEDFGSTGAFATAFHAVLDDDGTTLTYIDAGHGLAVIVGADGRHRRLQSSGLPVGPVVPGSWVVRTDQLAADDHLVVFSDGLLDRHAGVDEALAAVVAAVRADPCPQAIVATLLDRARPGRPDDDETVLVVRPRP